MTTETTTDAAIDEARLGSFIEQAVRELAAAASAAVIYVGDKLGLYRELAGRGPTTASELAAATGTNERLVLEWLRNQAAGGYVDHDEAIGTFTLPPEHAAVLADDASPVFMAAQYDVVASMWADTAKVMHAFRGDGGIDWGDHDHRLYDGIARSFRPVFEANLATEWLPALDGVVDKLRGGGRVADVGCGSGNSTVTMATAFPDATVVGYDRHWPSIATARSRAQRAGRVEVRFDVVDAVDLPEGDFDLICFFDALHDMGDPKAAAEGARRALADGGTVVVVEPKAGDTLADNQNSVSRMFYAGSVFMCTPSALAQPGPEALGAQAGPATMCGLLEDAGFRTARVAHESPLNTVIEARP
ncbi:MAG: class I SAM-dependent methyltransferase [Acidimicrobiales bacterium]|nr:class I SAM-dependent methyltransferase [Acidimicrobiales bacterium]